MLSESKVAIERFRDALLARPDSAAQVLSLYGVDSEKHEQEDIREMIQELTHNELISILSYALSATQH